MYQMDRAITSRSPRLLLTLNTVLGIVPSTCEESPHPEGWRDRPDETPATRITPCDRPGANSGRRFLEDGEQHGRIVVWRMGLHRQMGAFSCCWATGQIPSIQETRHSSVSEANISSTSSPGTTPSFAVKPPPPVSVSAAIDEHRSSIAIPKTDVPAHRAGNAMAHHH